MTSDRLKVHVLSTDERAREAARSLPADRFEVSLSTRREDALEVVDRMGCDIAVVELEVGGFGVVRDLRAKKKTKNARVVMLCDRPHDRWLCMQAGADAVIVKPLPDVLTLNNAIDSALAAVS